MRQGSAAVRPRERLQQLYKQSEREQWTENLLKEATIDDFIRARGSSRHKSFAARLEESLAQHGLRDVQLIRVKQDNTAKRVETICRNFRPRKEQRKGKHRSQGVTKTHPIDHPTLPSFDLTTCLLRNSPVWLRRIEQFDHYPLPRPYSYTKDWFVQEIEYMRDYWFEVEDSNFFSHRIWSPREPSHRNENSHLVKVAGEPQRFLEPAPGSIGLPWLRTWPHVYDLFPRSVLFRMAITFLEDNWISRELMEDSATVKEIPSDDTLIAWLLYRHKTAENVWQDWKEFLKNGVKNIVIFLQDQEEVRPDIVDLPPTDPTLVELMDDYRLIQSESLQRRPVPGKPPELPDTWHFLCPIHLIYHCPYHKGTLNAAGEDAHQAEQQTAWRPTQLQRGRIRKKYFSRQQHSCSHTCWKREQTTEPLETCVLSQNIKDDNHLADMFGFTSAERRLLHKIATSFDADYDYDACNIALMLPSIHCVQIHAYLEFVRRHERKTERFTSPVEPTVSSQVSNLTVMAQRPAPTQNFLPGRKAAKERKEAKAELDKNAPKQNTNETWGYYPCHHPGKACGADLGGDQECFCVTNGTFCDKFCDCSASCARRFKGCWAACHRELGLFHSKSCRTDDCPCFAHSRECDPEICRPYQSNQAESNGCCSNMQLFSGKRKICHAGVSDVEGLGLFIAEPCKKGELVIEYTGQLIDDLECIKRDIDYKPRHKTYIFTLNQAQFLDSEAFGNRARYINEASDGQNDNCVSKVMYVAGESRLGIYAGRNIKAGEELLMSYGETYTWGDD